jgi:hypothetical protein
MGVDGVSVERCDGLDEERRSHRRAGSRCGRGGREAETRQQLNNHLNISKILVPLQQSSRASLSNTYCSHFLHSIQPLPLPHAIPLPNSAFTHLVFQVSRIPFLCLIRSARLETTRFSAIFPTPLLVVVVYGTSVVVRSMFSWDWWRAFWWVEEWRGVY